MLTSTDGKKPNQTTRPSGALSSRQITALVQTNKWWPFDRVDGKLLVKLHKQHTRHQATIEQVEEAPW